ncbi:hypothetical protein AMS68_002638 [Peltaster fructicola]|uniref:Glycine zipper domain-containing protein n=1 Tax=Peltaster fructicola TaxID=286661 RepID=A0A6H0XR40_9PEZI|nr:hypothetical protein AMS68_002638 [Peltaster fructicola]
MTEDDRTTKAQQLTQAARQAEKATRIHHEAEQLKAQAATLTDPEERSRILEAAFKKELEAKGLSKTAKRLQSGYVQGAIGGAGIGAAVAGGLGTVVGTLVGGVLSIPTTAVGGLVGTAVGAAHGPFVDLTGLGKKQSSKGTSQGESLTAPDPGKLREAASEVKKQRDELKSQVDNKKKQGQQRGIAPSTNGSSRRRPRKLEVR